MNTKEYNDVKITYNKLVRDKIPEIIKKDDKTVITEILSNSEYIKLLDEKLNEECAEYQRSKEIEELADILEVIYAIAKSKDVSVQELERIRKDKVDKHGGFDKKILLKEVIDNKG